MTFAQANDDFNLQHTLQTRLIEFLHLAIKNGYHAGIKESIDAQRIAGLCNITDKNRLFWGLRSLLCSDHDEWKGFEELYQAYWTPGNRTIEYQAAKGPAMDQEMEQPSSSPQNGKSSTQADRTQQSSDGDVGGQGTSQKGASHAEVLEQSDFQLLIDKPSMREVELLVERLAQRMQRRAIRRQQLQRKGNKIHLRQTLRNSLRYGGTPLKLAYKARQKQQPRLIMLTDVSRSMSIYSYLFLRFARGILNAFRFAEAFAYHTRLLPISDVLRQADLTKMKESLALISHGWSGGTRIGESLHYFNQNYSSRVNSKSVVIIVSDGLDTGETDLLAQQLNNIKQRCHKLVWLNPLLGRDGYEPRAAAMQVALPFIDVFAPAHNIQSLRDLEPVLTSL